MKISYKSSLKCNAMGSAFTMVIDARVSSHYLRKPSDNPECITPFPRNSQFQLKIPSRSNFLVQLVETETESTCSEISLRRSDSIGTDSEIFQIDLDGDLMMTDNLLRNGLDGNYGGKLMSKETKRSKRIILEVKDWIDNSVSSLTRSKLLNEMRRPISEKDEPGWIYVYQMLKESNTQSVGNKQLPTHLYKIGRSINVYRRLTQWSHKCGYTPVLIDPPKNTDFRRASIGNKMHDDTSQKISVKCKYIHRAERLIHIELRDQFHAGIVHCNGYCGAKHNEWFKISDPEQIDNKFSYGWKSLRKVIKKWIKFVEKQYPRVKTDTQGTERRMFLNTGVYQTIDSRMFEAKVPEIENYSSDSDNDDDEFYDCENFPESMNDTQSNSIDLLRIPTTECDVDLINQHIENAWFPQFEPDIIHTLNDSILKNDFDYSDIIRESEIISNRSEFHTIEICSQSFQKPALNQQIISQEITQALPKQRKRDPVLQAIMTRKKFSQRGSDLSSWEIIIPECE
ncbi:hypothetical protein HK096_004974 [Nowakowskiella sp. JEL0078]|nr:hypothetical protein HK096_004974 [Nowakowskiella sp. JEL0078]